MPSVETYFRKLYGMPPYDLKIQPEPMILVAPKTYNMIRYYAHLGKLRPLPARKLRKCYLRKRMKRMQRARRRYL